MHLLTHPLVRCMICALGFGAWPIAQKLFGVPLAWAMLLMTSIQLPIAVCLVLWSSVAMPSLRSLTLFALFGAIPNALGTISIMLLLGQKGDVITKWLPVMAVMMPLVSLAGGAFLLGEVLTARKLCGVAIACFSIYLLSTH